MSEISAKSLRTLIEDHNRRIQMDKPEGQKHNTHRTTLDDGLYRHEEDAQTYDLPEDAGNIIYYSFIVMDTDKGNHGQITQRGAYINYNGGVDQILELNVDRNTGNVSIIKQEGDFENVVLKGDIELVLSSLYRHIAMQIQDKAD